MGTKISHEIPNARMTTMLDTHTLTKAFLPVFSEFSSFSFWLKQANAEIKPEGFWFLFLLFI